MKITIGEWKTRCGEKATVVSENPNAEGSSRLIGWVGNNPCCWGDDGRVAPWLMRNDIIAPWTDPVPWDWSTTPPWINCIIQGPSGTWYMCEGAAVAGNDGIVFNGDRTMQIPKEFSPKWSGDWKLSKTMRPGYKEVK